MTKKIECGIDMQCFNNYFEINMQKLGPVLFNYVWWILTEMKKRNLRTVYFLARDGYALYKIALMICAHFQLDIKCRYLYCSRSSLRLPSYHLIGEEAWDLICLKGYAMTPESILARVNCDPAEMRIIFEELKISQNEQKTALSEQAFADFCRKLRKSDSFKNFVLEKSKKAYPSAIAYFRQEGIFDESNLVLVDSGWTGSMQRSFRQLLRSADYQGNLIGFYFGLFSKPKSDKDGLYLAWYFDAASHIRRKALFNNNLFECILSAPHGMTLGYFYDTVGGAYKPILGKEASSYQVGLIETQISGYLQFSAARLNEITFSDFQAKKALSETQNNLYHLLFKPAKKDVDFWGSFLFCDDVTESYEMPLASASQVQMLKYYSLFTRVHGKIRKNAFSKPQSQLFWPYGTVSYLPAYLRWWYRFNIYTYECLRYFLQAKNVLK